MGVTLGVGLEEVVLPREKVEEAVREKLALEELLCMFVALGVRVPVLERGKKYVDVGVGL